MHVKFPPDSRTTRVSDDTILDLTADEDHPEGHAIERDGPDDDRAIQVTQELGDHLVEAWGFESTSTGSTTTVTDTSESDDEAAASGGDA